MKTERHKILVADCHGDMLIVLEKLLEDAGFDTTTVWTASEALRLVDSYAFDLVLLSEHLPDARCEEMLQVLRKRGEPIHCIVMQPREPRTADCNRFEALGAKDVVGKHCLTQIVELVRECLLSNREGLCA